jgi:uncharacterized repeat protein (TIGR01451 family)
VTNTSEAPETLDDIFDNLTSTFSYVSGSTTGITTADPGIKAKSWGNELKWGQLGLAIPAQSSSTLSFKTTSAPPEGTYCNEAWVKPGGQDKTSSGLTAKLVVGSPPSLLCPGDTVRVTKSVDPELVPANAEQTFTYTISIENTGVVDRTLKEIKDLLPPGFSYVESSSSGITVTEPQEKENKGPNNDRLELKWNVNPFTVPAATTLTQEFKATATPDSGDHFNEVWLKFDGLSDDAYTWPTAKIEAMSVMTSEVTNGEVSIECVFWVGSTAFVIDSCVMN